jgi:ribosomal-protein-serine acetyltransferase
MALSPRLDALGIRPLEAEDAAELYALVKANPDLEEWMPWAEKQDLAATERFIAGTEKQLSGNDGFQAAISPGGPIIGVVGFHSVDWINRNTSIGYWLTVEARGKGVMTTAVRALIDHAFSEWKLHRIEVHCAPDNHRSRALPSASASAKKRVCARPSSSAGATSTASCTACSRTSGMEDPPPPGLCSC